MTHRHINRLAARLWFSAALLSAFIGNGLIGTARAAGEPPPKLGLLFLGDNGHHQPAARFKQLQPALAARGIELTYTDDLKNLNPKTLGQYAGLVVYANHTTWTAEQEQAVVDYVAGGHGLIPLHCASACFGKSPRWIALVGARFQKHGTGVIRTVAVAADHPIMQGFGGFESWDETYIHAQHNEKDRTVLEARVEGERQEPWTWVRTEGKGRVFYTAWGHDERTWGHPGFQNLVERGIRWACGDDPSVASPFAGSAAEYIPKMTAKRTDVKPFEYQEAKVPFYPAGGARKGDGEWSQMQKPLDPAESLKHYVTPEGFELQLFAAEPDIGKPLAMTWDERGRLWLCETVDYPNELHEPPTTGRDRIRICEDTDGDNRADKFTVFAEGLSVPTTLAFYRGGVIVQNGSTTEYLRDTNGDDRADERHALLTGWGMVDTHGGVSNFRYGLDNWYWGMQGYNQSSPTTPEGKKLAEFRQGFFRFRIEGDPPRVVELEFIRSTNNNTWGLGISEEGLIFGSTANGCPSVFMPIANRYYESVRGWSPSVLKPISDSNQFYPITERVRQVDHHGGFTAAAGHALYTARTYPKEYWNRTAFVCEPTGHLVATFVLTPDGAGYRSKNSWNLVASDDEWAAPTMAEVGPDGNVWIIDWYNYIVQHNPTPIGFETGKGRAYETPLRDKTHGRVYRLVYKEAEPEARVSLAGASAEQLVATLKNTNMFWRLQAQRLLAERGKADVTPALVKLVEDKSVDEIDLNAGAIHALWTLKGLQAFDGDRGNSAVVEAVRDALEHWSPGVQRNAVMVAPASIERAVGDLLKIDDLDRQSRLAALLKLAEWPASTDNGISIFFTIALRLKDLNDPELADAATAAAARNEQEMSSALIIQENFREVPPKALYELMRRVAEHVARKPEPKEIQKWVVELAKGNADMQAAVLDGLSTGWPKNTPAKMGKDAEESLIEMWEKSAGSTRGTLFQLARKLGSHALDDRANEIATTLLATVADEKAESKARLAAARQLVEFRGDDADVAAKLLEQITPRTSSELAAGLMEAIGRSNAPTVGASLLAAMPTFTPAIRTAAVRAMLSRVDWSKALLDGLDAGQMQVGDLSLDDRQVLSSHPVADIRLRAKKILARGGGLPDPNRQTVLDELLPLTRQKGDSLAGKEIFKKQCSKCHTHSGEGNRVGPDLTGMAVHPKAELLVHILDPNRSVEGNYRVYTAQLDDGRVFTGLLVSESKTALELCDAEAKRHVLQRSEIEQLAATSKSLMPEGFEKQLKPDELTNLLEFLTARGKYLPLPLNKAATIVTTRGMFYSEKNDAERLVFSDWGPKTFAGVPFQLIDPQGDRVANAIMLNSPNGTVSNRMPTSAKVVCNTAAKAIHILGGVSGWGFAGRGGTGSTSLIVRLNYADGQKEDHALVNGVHLADYIRRVDVPESQFAFDLNGRQVRYLAIVPQRDAEIATIELVKGSDKTAPVVMAVTVEPIDH